MLHSSYETIRLLNQSHFIKKKWPMACYHVGQDWISIWILRRGILTLRYEPLIGTSMGRSLSFFPSLPLMVENRRVRAGKRPPLTISLTIVLASLGELRNNGRHSAFIYLCLVLFNFITREFKVFFSEQKIKFWLTGSLFHFLVQKWPKLQNCENIVLQNIKNVFWNQFFIPFPKLNSDLTCDEY